MPGSVLIASLPILVGWALDFLLGDPVWLPHPVRAIGWLISRLERSLRRIFTDSAPQLRLAGKILASIVPLTAGLISLAVLLAGYRIHFWLGFALECLLTWQILATRCLSQESGKVRSALERQDLPAARRQLSWLVGRDTEELPAAGVIRGAVETVAENTTDGVIAPLFWLALGGVPLALAYKAVNTLDSMVGYKNDRYLDFGRASARLDDAANFLPSRIAAGLMLAAAGFSGYSVPRAYAVFRRDRLKHASPNSAQTESVCAGALGIQLGGDNRYFGRLVHKPTIGDALREPEGRDIARAGKLLWLTAFLGLLAAWLLRLSCLYLVKIVMGA